MGSEKAFLLSVIYKGRKNFHRGGPEAVEAPGGWKKTPTQGARRLWKPRARAPRRELIQSHARRVVNLDT